MSDARSSAKMYLLIFDSSLPYSQPTPLDIFLNRAHTVSFAYLTGPHTSFLVHLSPRSYYTLLLKSQEGGSMLNDSPSNWHFDIPPSTIRSLLGQYETRPQGTTVARLELTSDVMITTSNATLSDFTSSGLVLAPSELLSQLEDSSWAGPHFHLPGTSVLTSLDHTLPEPPRGSHDQWVLDFTDGGVNPGIVMTHSRMKEIQRIVRKSNPATERNEMSLQIPYPGNWVSLLVRN